MSALAEPAGGVLVQGITGRQASWSVREMVRYGTRIVAGVVPGKGGVEHEGVPVYDLTADAVRATGATTAITFVPGPAAGEAMVEAIEAGIRLIVCPGDGIPIADALRVRRAARAAGAVLVGPNTPGVIMPGCWKLGFMPSDLYIPGPLGVISKSGSLSYEVCWRLTRVGIGQSTVMGIGGDPIKGTGVLDALRLFDSDRDTAAVLVLGEIGGFDEYQVLDHALRDAAKPVGVFLVGRTAPRGRRLGHAGALIGSARETFDAKAEALRQAGVPLAETLEDVIPMVRRLLDRTACKDGG